MKISPAIPATLCIAAGLLIVGDVFAEYMSGEKFEAFFFGVGMYFIGKGLFIHNVLAALSEFKQSR